MEQEKKEEPKELPPKPIEELKEKKKPGRKRKAVPTFQFEVKTVILQFD
jgi:hypothetical protein